MIFQFHKGAIGVAIVGAVNVPVAVFQFHKGAIGVMQAKLYEGSTVLISIP